MARSTRRTARPDSPNLEDITEELPAPQNTSLHTNENATTPAAMQERNIISPSTREFLRAGLHVARNTHDAVINISQTLQQMHTTAMNPPERNDQVIPIKIKLDVDNITRLIPTCDGSSPEDLVNFIQEIQNVVDSNLLPENQLIYYLLMKTTNELRTWWTTAMQTHSSWSTIKYQLLNTYLSRIDITILVDRLVRRNQHEHETFSQFTRDVVRKITALDVQMSELQIIDMIWAHTNRNTFEYIKYRTIPQTIRELEQIGTEIDQIQRRERQYLTLETNQEQINSPPNKSCNYCKRIGHTIQECRKRQSRSNQPKNE